MSGFVGMCDKTGTSITGVEHVRQSIRRIITTKIGSVIQLRDFGSDIKSLVSAPGNASAPLKAYALISAPILKWDPRVRLSRLNLTADLAGNAVIEYGCSYDGVEFTDNVLIDGVAS